MPYMYALYVCLICTHLRLFAVSSGVLLVGGVAERDPEVHRIFCVQPHKVRRAPNTCTAHTPQRLAATNSHHVRKAHSDGRARERRGSLSLTHTHTNTHTQRNLFSSGSGGATNELSTLGCAFVFKIEVCDESVRGKRHGFAAQGLQQPLLQMLLRPQTRPIGHL